MQVQTFSEIMASWKPRYRLRPRYPNPVVVARDSPDEPPFSYWDCEWQITPDSQEEGLEIFQRALQNDKIWNDAHRQIATTVAKAQVLASIPQKYEVQSIALTICPDQGNHETMLEIARIVATLKAIESGKFVIEQRSKGEEDPYGWHLHFNIVTTYPPSKIKQFVQQKLASRNYVATYYATKSDKNWLERYMSGSKGNEDKTKKVQKDKLLRTQLGLQDIYELKP